MRVIFNWHSVCSSIDLSHSDHLTALLYSIHITIRIRNYSYYVSDNSPLAKPPTDTSALSDAQILSKSTTVPTNHFINRYIYKSRLHNTVNFLLVRCGVSFKKVSRKSFKHVWRRIATPQNISGFKLISACNTVFC